MSSGNLENLARIGSLKQEPADWKEIDGLLESGRARMQDAGRPDLAFESRFDLGYNAAHSIALAALRACGYRSNTRFLVFQCLQHTLGLPPKQWMLLDICHRRRNIAEYEGHFEVDERLLREMLDLVASMLTKAERLCAAERVR
jgi:hypothetical protein